MFDYKFNKISLLEKILLMFKKSYYVSDSGDGFIVKLKCKSLFGNIYILKEEIIEKDKIW